MALDIDGIRKNGGFMLRNPNPIDVRTVVPYYANLKELIDNSWAYVGMVVYVLENKKLYVCESTDSCNWKPVSGLTVHQGSPDDLENTFPNPLEGDIVVIVNPD